MKTLLESILDDEDVVIDRMDSQEDNLLWHSAKMAWHNLNKRVRRAYPADRLGRRIQVGDWYTVGVRPYRVTDIIKDGKQYTVVSEDVDGIVKERELKTDNLIEGIKVMDKTAWINNLMAK